MVYSLARYIVVPEEKGSNLICISAIGATAGERFCMQHACPNCPSTMAVDDLRFFEKSTLFFLPSVTLLAVAP
jgi:hypothetical protein